MRHFLTIGSVASALIWSGIALAAPDTDAAHAPQISLNGSAFVDVRPDQASFTLGVVSEKPTAAEAAADNARAGTAALEMLKSLGIEAKDIRTTNLTLSPVTGEEREQRGPGPIKRGIVGYRASTSLLVLIRDVDKAGMIAAKVIDAGGNTYGGLTFSVSDRSAREDDLRGKAVSEAMRKASLYAHGAGMKLGRLISLVPEENHPIAYANDMGMARMASAAPMALPVEPGVSRIEVRVAASFELVPE